MARISDAAIRKLKLRKDVPVPPHLRAQRPWPFKRMKVGWSFVIPSEFAHNVEHAARRFAEQQRPPWQFTLRKLENNETGVWRVK